MRFLFIVTSFWAYGEMQIAKDFARQVEALGHQVMYLIPPSHTGKVIARNMRYQILIPNGATLNRVLLQDIENTYHPTHIVLSDILNFAFCERHYGLTEADLAIFSGFIGGFDLYNYAEAGKRIDTYGFRAKEMSRINIERYDFLLMPCPVNQVSIKDSRTQFSYRLFDGIKARMSSTIMNARERVGIKEGEKLVIMTGSAWQSSFRPYNNVKEMVDGVDQAVMQMIAQLPENYKVFWIGPRHRAVTEKLTKVKQINSLPPSQFEIIVDSADVFVSENFISTSMIRAALRGVPVVLLANSYVKRSGELRSLAGHQELDQLKYLDRIYPFRMFPVGWYSFLEPVVKGNPFYKLTRCAEVFDIKEAYETVSDSASEKEEESIKRLKQYKEKWLELPSVKSIVSSMNQITKRFTDGR